MNFNYNREYQTLEVTTENGMLQSVHIPEQYLEKLYFCLWAEISESDKRVGGNLQDADTFAVHRSGVADVKFSNVRWRGLTE